MTNQMKQRHLKGFEVLGTLIITAHEGDNDEYVNGMMFSGGQAYDALDMDERVMILHEVGKLVVHMIDGLSASIKEESN